MTVNVNFNLRLSSISKALLLDGPPCRNPDELEESELLDYLNDRNLSTEGTRDNLTDRYWNYERSIFILNFSDTKQSLCIL